MKWLKWLSLQLWTLKKNSFYIICNNTIKLWFYNKYARYSWKVHGKVNYLKAIPGGRGWCGKISNYMGHWCPTKSNYMGGWYFPAWKGKKEYYLPKKERSYIKSSQKKALSLANRSRNGHFCLHAIVKPRMFPSNIGKKRYTELEAQVARSP